MLKVHRKSTQSSRMYKIGLEFHALHIKSTETLIVASACLAFIRAVAVVVAALNAQLSAKAALELNNALKKILKETQELVK